MTLAQPSTPSPQAFDGPQSRSSRQFVIAAIVTLLLAIVPAVIWPGAISWMCDEPVLVAQACYFNQAHELANRGLAGNMGVPYGPLPTQYYQALLLVTHNLPAIVAIHAFTLSSVLAVSLLWLSRSLRLTPWFAACVVLCPYLWWGQRVLWDASFALPLGMLAVAAYASFLRTDSGKSLGLAMAAGLMGPLIHLQGLPLLLAFAGHLLLHRPSALRRHWMPVLIGVAVIFSLNAGYLHLILQLLPSIQGILGQGYPNPVSRASSLSGPMLGGALLDGEYFVRAIKEMTGPGRSVEAAVLVSRIITPLIWVGMACAVVSLVRSAGRRAIPPTAEGAQPVGVDVTGARREFFRISLVCLGLQLVMAVSLHVPPLPQYTFGTFPIHVLFGWFAVDLLQRVRLGLIVTAAWGLSLAYITLGSAWQIHRDGWSRWLFSASLDNQIEVARELNRYSDTTVWTNVRTYKSRPTAQALQCLRVILPPDPAMVQIRSPHGLLIRYKTSDDPNSSWIELVEKDGETPNPPETEEMDVAPWPRAY